MRRLLTNKNIYFKKKSSDLSQRGMDFVTGKNFYKIFILEIRVKQFISIFNEIYH